MNPLLYINWILFLAVVAYGLALFTYLIKTRYQFIKMGKKVEFDNDVKATIKQNLGVCFWAKEIIKR